MNRLLSWVLGALLIGLLAWFLISKKDHPDASYTETAKASSNRTVPAYFGAHPEWKLYEAANGKFKAQLPGVPQKASAKLHDDKTNEQVHFSSYYAQDSKGVVYLVNVLAYPEMDNVDESDLLKDTVQDVVESNPNNKLISSKEMTLHNHQAINFEIENNGSQVLGNVFRQGKHLFILMASTEQGSIDLNDFNYFIDAFEAKTN